MTKTVSALYDYIGTVHAVIQDLREQGISEDQISLVVRDVRGDYKRYLKQDIGVEEYLEVSAAKEGADVGVGTSALTGSLIGVLADSTSVVIPGVGEVLVAGPLVEAVNNTNGSPLPTANRGLNGALASIGIDEEQASFYAEAVRRGSALVAVTAPDEMANKAEEVMEDYFPLDVEERVDQWRRRGWETHKVDGKPLTEEQISKELGYYKRDIGQGDKAFLDAYETHYQRHLADTGRSFDEYLPAYQFGYKIATDERFRDDRWDQIDDQVRESWEAQGHPGTWDDYKYSIYFGWRKVKEIIG